MDKMKSKATGGSGGFGDEFGNFNNDLGAKTKANTDF
jgi:hypothetical protein